jgi:uncharacterized damage-inducible protein DinB
VISVSGPDAAECLVVSERRFPDMWVDPEDDPRETDTTVRGEKQVLAEYLDHYRTTLEMKCEGLDAEQMARRSVPPSTMSLLGLVRHLAGVEHAWFRRYIEGRQDLPRPYKSPDDRDLDFNGAVADDGVVADAWDTWRTEVAHARDVYDRVDDLGALVGPGPDQAEVREVVVHMIEEYARHLGHVDLLRECIDGRTGQ